MTYSIAKLVEYNMSWSFFTKTGQKWPFLGGVTRGLINLLPRKLLGLFRCMAVLYLGVYLFPGGEAVSLLRRASLATL